MIALADICDKKKMTPVLKGVCICCYLLLG